MSQMIKHVFWDLDGVFVDFVGGVLDLLGIDQQSAGDDWPPGEYSIEAIFGITSERLWNLINRGGANWWAHLDCFEWNAELRSLIADCRGSHSILTSPGDCTAAYLGKRLWCDRHMSGMPLHLTAQKQLLANPAALLIDDNDRNCELFRQAGGNAILFPQLWNQNHQLASQPFRIDYLENELRQLGVIE